MSRRFLSRPMSVCDPRRCGLPVAKGRCHEPTPVTPQYAPFASYKTAGGYRMAPRGGAAPSPTVTGRRAGAGAGAWPLPLRAQQVERARRVGVLIGFGENDPEGKVRLSAITQALAKLDWV